MSAAIEECRASGESLAVDDIAGHDRPLVIRGLCQDWPLVRLAGESDTAFAQGVAEMDSGEDADALLIPVEEDGVIGYNAAFDGFNYEHHRVSVTQVLKRLAHSSRRDDAPGLALQSALIATCLPGFLQRHSLPFLDPVVQPRIWIGNRVTTPVHFDEYHNIACVVCGSRKFTLFAPDQVSNLYIGPLDFAPTGAAMGMARLDRPEDPRYPRLKQALAAAQVAELQPGDAIYIPPMWWHHVQSLKRINALVNYWWKTMPADSYVPQTALGCLMHCILTFRSLPPAEKAAWKGLLDFYVFDDGDAGGHIPLERRGLLGALSPEQVDGFRETIRRYL